MGSDGIGDQPYKIDENNIDRYPLMKPVGISKISSTASTREVEINGGRWRYDIIYSCRRSSLSNSYHSYISIH
ncbi:MAG: hypothetical protein B6U89_04275 [Desulfurococcales archaeon ex4484_58]|nr:MAG: hypothetical protein B6U89_04275 [Desulfurococcales archaeon ex4484_58]